MTDEDALYRAIIANPAEDTPRLAYADWLEENNRPEEAEFIRLDCRLHAEGPDEPMYAEHINRLQELRIWLDRHGSQRKLGFEKGISPSTDEWWGLSGRGFPRFLTISTRLASRGVKKLALALERAFQRIPTRWVAFEHIGASDLAELLRQPVASAFDHITLNGRPTEEEEPALVIAAASQLSNLRGLHLSFQITERAASALGRSANLLNLEQFSVEAGNLTPRAVRALAGEWFLNLRELGLESGLPTDAFEEVCRLQAFPRLHTLLLTENAIPPIAWREFTRSKSFPALRVLDVHSGDMSEGQLSVLASHPHLQLATLDATFCSVGDDAIRALVNAPWVESLRTLQLGYCNLGPEGAAAIASCGKLAGLKCLGLDANHLGTAGLQSIAGSSSLRGLVSLQLDGQARLRRPSKAIRHFLESLNMPALRQLALNGLPLGPHAAILANDRFRNLRRLSLSNCQLTDDGAQELLQAPCLQKLIELRLHRNNLGRGVELLADRHVLPELSYCSIDAASLPAGLAGKLARRKGFLVR